MNIEPIAEHVFGRLRNELSPALSYHCWQHTADVRQAAVLYSELEGLSPEDRELVEIAAIYHDSGFMTTTKEHEAQSCLIARAELPGFGLHQDQIEKICTIIMATRLPQVAATPAEMVLADADLDYLGRSDYFTISALLIQEWQHNGMDIDHARWRSIQIEFLSKHNYFTKSAKQLRDAQKAANLEQIKNHSI